MAAILISLAAMLWATDSLFRYGLLSKISTLELVTLEHLINFILITIIALFVKKKSSLKFWDYLALIYIGVFASALGLYYFSLSFHYINPSISILLQKVQPLIAILLSYVFLKEKLPNHFLKLSLIAIIAAMFLSFPNADFIFHLKDVTTQSKGTMYALLAAFLWGSGTVVGKKMTNKLSNLEMLSFRFGFGFLGLIVILFSNGNFQIFKTSLNILTDFKTLTSLFYISLLPGLVAMFIYYQGLRKTTAQVATICELAFPLGAVLINWHFLNKPLNIVQIISGVVLLCVIIFLGIVKGK